MACPDLVVRVDRGPDVEPEVEALHAATGELVAGERTIPHPQTRLDGPLALEPPLQTSGDPNVDAQAASLGIGSDIGRHEGVLAVVAVLAVVPGQRHNLVRHESQDHSRDSRRRTSHLNVAPAHISQTRERVCRSDRRQIELTVGRALAVRAELGGKSTGQLPVPRECHHNRSGDFGHDVLEPRLVAGVVGVVSDHDASATNAGLVDRAVAVVVDVVPADLDGLGADGGVVVVAVAIISRPVVAIGIGIGIGVDHSRRNSQRLFRRLRERSGGRHVCDREESDKRPEGVPSDHSNLLPNKWRVGV